MTKNIRQKLQGIQSSLKAPKGQTNKFGGYKYRSAEDILEAVKPLLAEWQCVLTVQDEVVDNCSVVFCATTIRFHCSERIHRHVCALRMSQCLPILLKLGLRMNDFSEQSNFFGELQVENTHSASPIGIAYFGHRAMSEHQEHLKS